MTSSESKGSEPSITMITTSKSELPTTMESTFTTEPDSESKETSKTEDVTSKATQEPDTEHIVFTAKTTTVSSAQAQQVHQEEPEDVSITDTATEPVISMLLLLLLLSLPQLLPQIHYQSLLQFLKQVPQLNPVKFQKLP